MKLLSQLTESGQYPSRSHLAQAKPDLKLRIYLMLISLNILRDEWHYKRWAMHYANRTLMMGTTFDALSWSATDLYLLCHLYQETESEDQILNRIVRYLRNIGNGHPSTSQDRRFLFNLDFDFSIRDVTFRAVRRLGQEWGDLTTNERKLTLTRLLQYFRAHAARTDLRPPLEDLARRNSLELHDVCNTETGMNCSSTAAPPARHASVGPLAYAAAAALGAAAAHALRETSTAGATSAGNIAGGGGSLFTTRRTTGEYPYVTFADDAVDDEAAPDKPFTKPVVLRR